MKRSILATTLFSVLCACSVSGEVDPGPGGVDAAPDGDDDDPAPEQPDGAPAPIDLSGFCNQWNTAVCSHFFSCYSEAERVAAGIPPTEGECVAAQAPDCEDATSETVCDSGQVYQPDQATPCLTQLGALTCEQFRDPDKDAVLAANAPACVAMCQ